MPSLKRLKFIRLQNYRLEKRGENENRELWNVNKNYGGK